MNQFKAPIRTKDSPPPPTTTFCLKQVFIFYLLFIVSYSPYIFCLKQVFIFYLLFIVSYSPYIDILSNLKLQSPVLLQPSSPLASLV